MNGGIVQFSFLSCPSKDGSKLVVNSNFGVDASAMAAGKDNLALSARSKCA